GSKEQGRVEALLPTAGALMLFTSGSTGVPKGVLLNHQNILAMSAGTIQANQLTDQDVTLNWMPLDHVGAIVFLSCLAVDLGVEQIHVPTAYILEDPLRFLDLIQIHRASMSWAPNFAFSLINNLPQEIALKSWDLSSMRFLVNAGEQISAKAARQFLQILAPHQLSDKAIVPAFGMSETCSGISWSLDFCAEGGEINNVVSLGPPIPGAAFRIVDDQGEVLPQGSIGHFEIKGASLFSGYYQRDDLNREVFGDDGWFNTGDMGYMDKGQLYLTGRNKDDIIINGVNFFSHEIEQALEELPEVEVSFAAASA
ncbi:MAG: AMP-binding protein, partial [Psychrosphaera sp.]|nr:AMP-binding protein [Psychrosphaera sp.]